MRKPAANREADAEPPVLLAGVGVHKHGASGLKLRPRLAEMMSRRLNTLIAWKMKDKFSWSKMRVSQRRRCGEAPPLEICQALGVPTWLRKRSGQGSQGQSAANCHFSGGCSSPGDNLTGVFPGAVMSTALLWARLCTGSGPRETNGRSPMAFMLLIQSNQLNFAAPSITRRSGQTGRPAGPPSGEYWVQCRAARMRPANQGENRC